jgi:Flp pilus assembly protein TadG
MERGETTAQAVLAVPVLLLFLFFGVQVSMYFNTAQLAAIAAQDGAIAGSISGGSEIRAIAAAVKSTAEQRASEGKTPEARIDNGLIEVKVILYVPSIVPFFPTLVTRSASEPLERFVLEVDR